MSSAADKLTLHILSRRDIRSGGCYDGWDDPDRIAPLDPAKWRTLADNPLAGGDDEPVQIIGLCGKRVIGRMDMFPSVLTVDGKPLRVYWGSHLYVPPEFRNTLMGLMLIMKAQALCDLVGASGPSQAALPVYQKLKWLDLPMSRQILIVRSRPVVAHYVKFPAAAIVFSAIVDVGLRAHRLLVAIGRARRARGLFVERVAAMPAEVDAHFAQRPQRVLAHRSAAFINWQLTHAFKDEARNANALYLVRDRRGGIVAYFLNKIRFHETATHRGFKNVLLGSPQDWMVLDNAGVEERVVVSLAIRELIRSGVDAVEFCTSDVVLRSHAKRMGFVKLGQMHWVLKAGAKNPLSSRYHDLAQWWIRPGDGDNFFV